MYVTTQTSAIVCKIAMFHITQCTPVRSFSCVLLLFISLALTSSKCNAIANASATTQISAHAGDPSNHFLGNINGDLVVNSATGGRVIVNGFDLTRMLGSFSDLQLQNKKLQAMVDQLTSSVNVTLHDNARARKQILPPSECKKWCSDTVRRGADGVGLQDPSNMAFFCESTGYTYTYADNCAIGCDGGNHFNMVTPYYSDCLRNCADTYGNHRCNRAYCNVGCAKRHML